MEIIVIAVFLLIVIVVIAASLKRSAPLAEFNLRPFEESCASLDTSVSPPQESVELSALLPQHFIVLDLETTGLNPYRDEIIEFGAIRVNLASDNHTSFRTLVKPNRKVPRKITEITGITQEMVDSEGLELRDALNQFIEFIGDLPLVTYNADFDMGFLYSAAKKHEFVIGNRYTCALKRARRAWPGLPSYSLVNLAKMGRLSDEDTHRALGDCKRAMIVFISATSKLGQKVRWSKPQVEPGVLHQANAAPESSVPSIPTTLEN
jgi:DNA polymerase III epsilon subunit family exonuclease